LAQQEVELKCEVCGKIFYRKPYGIRSVSPGRFCSNECKGSYVGNTVGFGGAGRGNRGAPRKWNYDRVYALQDERGWGCDRIGRELGIPSSTVSCILHRRRKNVQPNSYSTCP